MNIKAIILASSLFIIPVVSQAQSLYIENLTAAQGETIDLPVSMSNASLGITSFDCKITLPEGAEIATKNGKPIFTLTERKDDHTIAGSILTNGDYKLIAYSSTNSIFSGESGVVLTAPVTLNLEPGVYTIAIKEVTLTEKLPDSSNVIGHDCPDTSATLTVTAPEVKRYGDNQLYAKDMTINQGENATLLVGYNSQSDVYEYGADIVLPEGVTATAVIFESVVTDVNNFTNDWSFDAPTLKLSGEYGGGRKDQPAEGGDKLFATVTLNTSSLAAGEYLIKVQNQKLFNDDDLYPEAYDAILTVVGGAVVPTEQCATPEISIDNNGNIVATCETTGAKLHTTITVDDHKTVHHDSGETVELSGQYHVTSYATADGMEDSEPATATLAWAKNYTDPTGVQEVGTERALLIYSVGDYLVIKGTIEDEPVAVYDLGGTILYGGKATANTFMVPDPLTKGTVYIITIGGRNIKHVL